MYKVTIEDSDGNVFIHQALVSDVTEFFRNLNLEDVRDVETEEEVETLQMTCDKLGLDYAVVKDRLSKSVCKEHLNSII